MFPDTTKTDAEPTPPDYPQSLPGLAPHDGSSSSTAASLLQPRARPRFPSGLGFGPSGGMSISAPVSQLLADGSLSSAAAAMSSVAPTQSIAMSGGPPSRANQIGAAKREDASFHYEPETERKPKSAQTPGTDFFSLNNTWLRDDACMIIGSDNVGISILRAVLDSRKESMQGNAWAPVCYARDLVEKMLHTKPYDKNANKAWVNQELKSTTLTQVEVYHSASGLLLASLSQDLGCALMTKEALANRFEQEYRSSDKKNELGATAKEVSAALAAGFTDVAQFDLEDIQRRPIHGVRLTRPAGSVADPSSSSTAASHGIPASSSGGNTSAFGPSRTLASASSHVQRQISRGYDSGGKEAKDSGYSGGSRDRSGYSGGGYSRSGAHQFRNGYGYENRSSTSAAAASNSTDRSKNSWRREVNPPTSTSSAASVPSTSPSGLGGVTPQSVSVTQPATPLVMPGTVLRAPTLPPKQ